MENVFSDTEQKVLKILGRRKMTIAQLAEKIKPDLVDPNNYLAGVVRRITRKCEHYHMTWTLKGKGAGRHGRTIWRETKGKKH